MRKLVLTFFLMMAAGIALHAYTVRGSVFDSQGEPMIRAAVRLLAPKDSTAVQGALTNDNGEFAIADVKKGKYILETSYVGSVTDLRDIEVKGNADIGQIVLRDNDVMLKDINVVGIQTPIRVATDTVEFNADSYKTQPNAVVEDLLKRLPGVEVGTDGKITHNGKQISKILVDGQEFFSDDPTVASRNLPVNMVDKLQVVDRKSDLARMTGVDDGEEETVINLTVKKGMKNGWFGNVEAGYGTDGRYKGSFIVNRFWNNNQITFIGGGNNINDMSFTDGGAGRFRRFGGNNGITKSEALGVNFNVGNEEILRVGGDLMYTHTRTDTRTQLDRQNLLPNGTTFYDSKTSNINRGHNVRGDFRLQWNPDSCNTFEFRPNFSLNFNDASSDNSSNTWNGLADGKRGDKVNSNTSLEATKGKSYDFGGRLIYNHKVASHPGRSFSLFANYRMSNVREYANSYSKIMYYLNNQDSIFDQYEDNHTWSNTVSGRVSWTEPIGNPKKGNFIEFAYRLQYRWNNADKITYDRPADLPLDQLFLLHLLPEDQRVDSLSNQFRNDYMNQDIRIGYKHVTRAHNLNVGLSIVPQMSKSINLIDKNKTIPERWTWNVAPYMRYRWRITDMRSVNINYQGRAQQPSMNQLQPVADYSNPLNIVAGNPNLDPSFTHNLRANFNDFDQKAQRSIMAMCMASVTQNSIVSRTSYNPATGGQYTTYENVNGVWNVNAFSLLSFPFKNKSWTFSSHVNIGYNHRAGYNNDVRNNSGTFNFGCSPGIAFRPANLELEARPLYNFQTTSNSIQTVGSRTVHNYGGRFSGTYYAPFGLVLNTDLTYTSSSGYGQGYNRNVCMWNASISYQTLRDRSLVITLSGNDLLQQRSNIQRSVTGNYIQDALYNSLTRYFMVSVTWKFNTFGKGNEPADRNRPNFGPGGPMGPPPGGRPGGRPPF